MQEILDNILIKENNKNKKGLSNELLINGNLKLKGHNGHVLNDHNPNYDIIADKFEIECKLDTLSDKTNNFYFEVYNYTYNRKCGICNDNMKTIYCHTFKLNGIWKYIINYRCIFVNVLKEIKNKYPDKIRAYNNTYFIDGQLVGDKAYLVDIETFFTIYKAKVYDLHLALQW
jgi:hypothetical protein